MLADHPAVGPRERHRLVDDGGEHRLRVQGRVHDLTDLAERAQLLHGSGELLRTLVEGLEESHVVDGDDRLVGEGREQCHVAVVEGPHLATVDRDRADTVVVLQHGHEGHRADALDVRRLDPVRHALAVGFALGDVLDLQGLALHCGARGQRLPLADGHGIRAHPLDELGPRTLVRDEPEVLTLADQQEGEGRLAEPGRAREDGFEHGPVVGRRAADGAQDVAGGGLAFQRLAELVGAGLEGLEEAHVVDGDHGLVGKDGDEMRRGSRRTDRVSRR